MQPLSMRGKEVVFGRGTLLLWPQNTLGPVVETASVRFGKDSSGTLVTSEH